MAEVTLKRPDVLAANRDVVARLLAPFAAGSRHACLAIIPAGADPAPALDLAKTEVERDWLRDSTSRESRCSTPVPLKPRCWRRFSIQKSALGSPHYAQTYLDRREVTYSRWNDLAGLANIASEIDEGTQASLLPQVLEIARGQHDGGPADDNSAIPEPCPNSA